MQNTNNSCLVITSPEKTKMVLSYKFAAFRAATVSPTLSSIADIIPVGTEVVKQFYVGKS